MNSGRTAVVDTVSGSIEGAFENGLYIFRGIPYAAPPVGDLRWLPPQPVAPWPGVRKADRFGGIAPQNLPPRGPLPVIREDEPQSEDCLFLNIWTPALDNKKRSVMVWIHGGAFVGGSGSSVSYTNGALARRGDIVEITINYRLGYLGFLRLKDVTGGRIPSTGNEGLLDQIAALKWVGENISAFGGDPDNITVFGESAGGMSIGCLLAMPAARGLFHKAICESGVGNTSVSLERANTVAAQFLETHGVKVEDAAALRELSVEKILSEDMKVKLALAKPGESVRSTVTAPVIDGELIPDVTNRVIRRGSAKGIPVLVGTNLDEWKLFAMMQPGSDKLDESMLQARLAAVLSPEYTPAIPSLLESYRKALVKRGVEPTPPELVSAIQTDAMFRLPSIELVEAQRDNGTKAYNYLFDWVSPALGGSLGACHALEIGFVHGTYTAEFNGAGPEAEKLSGYMQDAWLSFARTGDPGSKSLGAWPEYGRERLTMILGRNCRIEAAVNEDERKAWDGIMR